MSPVTQSQHSALERRGKRVVPYKIPAEVLGEIFGHVTNPAEFGAVNSAFRDVQSDAYFENRRRQMMGEGGRLIEDAIHRNNGSRVFDHHPFKYNNAQFQDLFFNRYGCIVVDGSDILSGRSIDKITYKAILYVNTLFRNSSNELVEHGSVPLRAEPVGRFTLGSAYVNKQKLTKPCYRSHVHFYKAKGLLPDGVDYNTWLSINLKDLQKIDQDYVTSTDLIKSIFPYENVYFLHDIDPKNVKIVNKTLEVHVPVVLQYGTHPPIDRVYH